MLRLVVLEARCPTLDAWLPGYSRASKGSIYLSCIMLHRGPASAGDQIDAGRVVWVQAGRCKSGAAEVSQSWTFRAFCISFPPIC